MKAQRVLLIQVPYLQQEHVFPLGLAYVASFVRQQGYDVAVYDINLNKDSKSEVVRKLATFDFDHVGISALANRYRYVEWLAKEIKKIRNVPITLGNGLGTGSYEVVLRNIPEVDFCVLGEGEETYLDLLQNCQDPRGIEGIAFRDNHGEIVVTPRNAQESKVKEFPWPAYDLFDMSKYFVESSDFLDTGYFSIRGSHECRRKMAYMITARGCPYDCKFCGRIIEHVRLRDISDVVKEVRFLKETFGVSGITFYDELLTLNKKRTLELARALHELDILWSCQGRVNLVDLEFLRELKKCGCVSLGYGIESGSQTILDAMDKRISVEQIVQSMQAADEAGLDIKIQLIFGYPGENRRTIRETVDLFRKMKSPGRRFNILRPLPGSRLYDELVEQGVLKDEREYLENLGIALDMNLPIVNLTSFADDEVKIVACRAEAAMLMHYLIHMLGRHPAQLLKKFRHSKGSFHTVTRHVAKSLLSYCPPLFNSLLRDRYPPSGYRVYHTEALLAS